MIKMHVYGIAYYSAAAMTAIAGILHLIMSSNKSFNQGGGVLFIVGEQLKYFGPFRWQEDGAKSGTGLVWEARSYLLQYG